jgi:hypothetical protein
MQYHGGDLSLTGRVFYIVFLLINMPEYMFGTSFFFDFIYYAHFFLISRLDCYLSNSFPLVHIPAFVLIVSRNRNRFLSKERQ